MAEHPFRLALVAPVYDDAPSGNQLLRALGKQFAATSVRLHILLVDDGSHLPLAEELDVPAALQDSVVEVLRLRRNVGHQRAIALGTAHVQARISCDAMLVMDADGEDRPEDAWGLLQRFRSLQPAKIVFAERTRRSESRLFLLLYRIYQLLHWLLTGIRVRVGNFSIVPSRDLSTLVTLPEMWNHYAAAIFHSRLSFETIPTTRGRRYSGCSKMNFFSLVMHGLQAISVFTDVIAVRLLLVVVALSGLCASLFLAGLVRHFFSSSPWPGWVSYAGGALAVMGLVTAGYLSLVLRVISQRNRLDFIPIRDYQHFVETVSRVEPRHE